MPLPASTRHGVLPTEMEYVASSETLVDILPLVSLDRVRLLSGTYGPFHPPAHAVVPLWLAISLRKKRKCVIVPPEWLTVGKWVFSHVQMHSRSTFDRRQRHCPSPHYHFISWPYRSFCLSSTYSSATYVLVLPKISHLLPKFDPCSRICARHAKAKFWLALR